MKKHIREILLFLVPAAALGLGVWIWRMDIIPAWIVFVCVNLLVIAAVIYSAKTQKLNPWFWLTSILTTMVAAYICCNNKNWLTDLYKFKVCILFGGGLLATIVLIISNIVWHIKRKESTEENKPREHKKTMQAAAIALIPAVWFVAAYIMFWDNAYATTFPAVLGLYIATAGAFIWAVWAKRFSVWFMLTSLLIIIALIFIYDFLHVSFLQYLITTFATFMYAVPFAVVALMISIIHQGEKPREKCVFVLCVLISALILIFLNIFGAYSVFRLPLRGLVYIILAGSMAYAIKQDIFDMWFVLANFMLMSSAIIVCNSIFFVAHDAWLFDTTFSDTLPFVAAVLIIAGVREYKKRKTVKQEQQVL